MAPSADGVARGTPPDASGAAFIGRLSETDLEAARALLEPSALHLDLAGELRREIALPWLIRGSRSGPPVGFLLAWQAADELQLLELATHPAERRRGFARALLGALIEYAKSAQTRLILLEVRSSNGAAIALYESVGFRSTGVRRGYYADTAEDALEMRITLDPETGAVVPNEP